MADRDRLSILFKHAVWTCPICGQVDHQPLSINGGDEHTNVCTKCGQKVSGPEGTVRRVYTGTLRMDPEEYTKADPEAIDAAKQAVVDVWLESERNRPAPVEPTAADLEREISEHEARIKELAPRIKACPDYQPPTVEKIREKRKSMVDALDKFDLEIAVNPALPTVVQEMDEEVVRLGAKAGRVQKVADSMRDF